MSVFSHLGGIDVILIIFTVGCIIVSVFYATRKRKKVRSVDEKVIKKKVLPIHAVNNMGTSLDERDLYCPGYKSIGYPEETRNET